MREPAFHSYIYIDKRTVTQSKMEENLQLYLFPVRKIFDVNLNLFIAMFSHMIFCLLEK